MMNKYLFIIILSILIMICILLLIFIIKSIIKNKLLVFKNPRFILKLILMLILSSYTIWGFQRFLLLVKLFNFKNEVISLLTAFEATHGVYPKNIDELMRHEYFKEKTKHLLFPLKHKFGLFGNTQGEIYNYIFYAYGLDNDDDKIVRTYEINYLYALIPHIDGDIILDKDRLEEIKLYEKLFNNNN